jgi:molybdopterin synthase sulfur carrier subunit
MTINIKYFGQIAEVTQVENEQFDFNKNSVSELIEVLFNKYPELKTKDFKVALNQELVDVDTQITGGEIALLPPFAGG